MSKESNKINIAIRKVQEKKGLTRTNAIQWIGLSYGIAYATLHVLAKHGKMPTRNTSIEVINRIIKDYS